MARDSFQQKKASAPPKEGRSSAEGGRAKKKTITIRIDEVAIRFFKGLAVEYDMPYQSLINMYLMECARNGMKPSIQWLKAAETTEGP